MTEDVKKTEQTVVETSATALSAEVTIPESNKELVMEAKISKKAKPSKKTEKTEKPKQKTDKTYSASTCIITNTSMNTICLFNGDKLKAITVAPREIKTVERENLRELLKNEMVKRFFDKGILTHTLDAADVSAHDAVVPEELKNPVERHEGGQNVKAEVKTYRKEGTINLDLG